MIGLESTMRKHIWYYWINMELNTFIIIWVGLMLICVYETYFTVPYDKEFKQLKKEKNEYKSTN